MSNYYHYNRRLKGLARALRKQPTRSENTLWYEVLSDKQFYGIRFYRQRPIGKYIVDFFSKELNLVIELDGITHQYDDAYDNDQQKDKDLSAMGYCVLRFDDADVLNDLSAVVDALVAWMEEHFPNRLNDEPGIC